MIQNDYIVVTETNDVLTFRPKAQAVKFVLIFITAIAIVIGIASMSIINALLCGIVALVTFFVMFLAICVGYTLGYSHFLEHLKIDNNP
jgi:uncharacterized membrane protein